MDRSLSRAIELDFLMLDGVFFTEVQVFPEFIVALHDKSSDQYSNGCGRIRCTADNARSVLDRINRIFADHHRNLSISTSPFTEPANFSEYLDADGYVLDHQDAWMFYNGDLKEPQSDESVSIKKVDSPEELDVFVDTFNRSYSGTDPNEPYGVAPPEWGETFKAGYGLEMPGRQVEYYVLFSDGKPASILSTCAMEVYGGIYGVGTVPEMRGKGLASKLTLYVVNRLKSIGAEHVFLQTEKDSYNESLYKKMGFSTEWYSQTWHR